MKRSARLSVRIVELIRINCFLVSSFVIAVEGEHTVVHLEDSVRVLSDREVVRYHDERLTHIFPRFQKEAEHLISVFAVEVTRWLVCKENVGHIYERTRYRNSLLLTSRELGGEVVQSLCELERFDEASERLLI